jgi:hypothetical protein
MRSRATLALLAGLVVLAAGAVHWWVPWLTRDRDFSASVPQPPPLFNLPYIGLDARERACFPDAVMDTHSETARFRVHLGRRPAQPLTLTLGGPGYRLVRRIPATYTDDATIRVPVRAPARDVAVRVCLSNDGRRRIALFGSDDQTKAPYSTHVGGRPVKANPQFAFYERRPVAIADRTGVVMARVRTFRPGIVGPGLVWPLVALVVIGVPAGVLFALYAGWSEPALRGPDDDRASGEVS